MDSWSDARILPRENLITAGERLNHILEVVGADIQ